jgi:hypothetical protein
MSANSPLSFLGAVVVSHVKQGYADGFAPQGKTEKEYIAQTIRQLRAWFEDTETWMRAFPERTCIFSFDEMKRNLPGLVRRIFTFLGLDVSSADIQAQCDAHSYQAYAKRKEGESGETVRTAYMWRKGVSGDWKNHFDLELRQHFEDVCGTYLLGFGATSQTPAGCSAATSPSTRGVWSTQSWQTVHPTRGARTRPRRPRRARLFVANLRPGICAGVQPPLAMAARRLHVTFGRGGLP